MHTSITCSSGISMATSTGVPGQSVMAASVYTWICLAIYDGKILINNLVIDVGHNDDSIYKITSLIFVVFLIMNRLLGNTIIYMYSKLHENDNDVQMYRLSIEVKRQQQIRSSLSIEVKRQQQTRSSLSIEVKRQQQTRSSLSIEVKRQQQIRSSLSIEVKRQQQTRSSFATMFDFELRVLLKTLLCM